MIEAGGGGQSSSSSSIAGAIPVDMTPRQYKRLRTPTALTIADYMMTGGGPEYTGPFSAGMTPEEQAALASITTDPSENWQGADQYIAQALSGAFSNPESNPALKAYIDAAVRPINEAYNEGDLEARALFSRAGHRLPQSSPFSLAASKLAAGRMQAIGDTTAKIAFPAYEAGQARQERASSMAREADQMRLAQNMKVLEAKALPRLIEQYGIAEGYAEFQRRQNVMMQLLGLAGGITSGTVSQISGSQSQSTSSGGEGNIGILSPG